MPEWLIWWLQSGGALVVHLGDNVEYRIWYSIVAPVFLGYLCWALNVDDTTEGVFGLFVCMFLGIVFAALLVMSVIIGPALLLAASVLGLVWASHQWIERLIKIYKQRGKV